MSLRSRLFALLGIASVSVTASAIPESTSPRLDFEFALYFTPAPKTDPEQALIGLLEKEFAEELAYLSVRFKWSDLADYAPPGPDSFRYVTVDLDPSQGAAMAKAERVFILHFEAEKTLLLRANRVANGLTHRLAELTDGLPWDEESRLLYSRAAWRERLAR